MWEFQSKNSVGGKRTRNEDADQWTVLEDDKYRGQERELHLIIADYICIRVPLPSLFLKPQSTREGHLRQPRMIL